MRSRSAGSASAASGTRRCACQPSLTSSACSTAWTSGCRLTRSSSAYGCSTTSSTAASVHKRLVGARRPPLLARLPRLWTDIRLQTDSRGAFPDLADVHITRANCAYDLAPQGSFPASVRVEPEPGKLPVPVLGVISQDSPRRVPGRAAGEVDHTVGKLGH